MQAELTAARMRQFKYFQSLTDEDAEHALQAAEPVCLDAEEVLFCQGDEGDSVYLLAKGRMQIRVDIPGPEDHVLAELEPGAILGEVALLLDRPRTGSACALEPCELWRITREAYRAQLHAGQPWAQKFLLATSQMLAHRLDTVNHQVVALSVAMRELAQEVTRTPEPSVSPTPSTRVAELDLLRQRLFQDWSF